MQIKDVDSLFYEITYDAGNGRWSAVISAISRFSQIASFRDSNNSSLLIELSYYCDRKVISILCDMGGDVNDVNSSGETPLINAVLGKAERGNSTLDCLELLLLKGANPDLIGCNGMTALHWAIDKTLVEYVEMLLQYGADVKVCTKGREQEDSLALIEYIDNPTIRQKVIEAAKQRLKGT